LRHCATTRCLALAALALLASALRAEDEMPVKAELQVKLLLKVLTYDRQLEVKAGEELVIGVVSSPTSAASAKATADISSELYKYLSKTVKQLKLQFFLHDYSNPDKLAAWVKARKISVLYVSPGNGKNVPAILAFSQQNKVTTMTGVPEYVRMGVAVGIGARQSRPQVLINLSSTKREGSEFDASLLRIAEIINK
jgi:hypothetical protein